MLGYNTYLIQINVTKLYCFKYSYLIVIIIWFQTGSLAQWVECSPMVRETRVQSQVKSYQRLKKWYLIPPCLPLSIIRYVSRVKWSHPGKGVVPSPSPWCSSYWKGSLRVALDYSRQLYLTYMVSSTYFNLIIVICFHIVIWFQVTNYNRSYHFVWTWE